ncbi:unnamed protein product, partial [Mycena citricolor]
MSALAREVLSHYNLQDGSPEPSKKGLLVTCDMDRKSLMYRRQFRKTYSRATKTQARQEGGYQKGGYQSPTVEMFIIKIEVSILKSGRRRSS